MTLKVIQGHIEQYYGPILMKICLNAKIMKTQFFHKIINDLKSHFYFMMEISTLTTVLMDNLCPCFLEQRDIKISGGCYKLLLETKTILFWNTGNVV